MDLPQPYLLFLGDVTEPGYAKTAFGLRRRGMNVDFRATGQGGITWRQRVPGSVDNCLR